MRNNAKYKSRKASSYDWSKVSSKASSKNKTRFSLLSQSTPPRTKKGFPFKKLFQRITLLAVLIFIVYQVFFFAKNINFSFTIPDKLTNFIEDVASRIKFSKASREYQVYESDLSLPSYTSFDVLGISSKPTIRASVKSGETLEGVIKRYGFKAEDAKALQSSLDDYQKRHSNSVQLKAGASLEIEMNQEGEPSELTLQISEKELLKFSRNSAGLFSYTLLDKQTKTGERILFGGIESSFASAATKSGMSYDLVDDLVDIFSDRVSFHKDFRKGDRFTVIYQEHENVDGAKAKSGSGVILAAALEVGGKNLVAIRFVSEDGKARYFNENGQIQGDSFLRFPVKFSKISSYFTTARFHPVLKIKRPHNGVDFAAPIGTPVRTVGDGVIQFAGRQGGHGIIVEVKHSDRFVTGYSHLSSIASGLKRGMRVQRGQVIGAVGMTGLATGPHLHFSLFDRGKYVDPLKSELPRTEEITIRKGVSERYFKRALFTLQHYQSAASNSAQAGF